MKADIKYWIVAAALLMISAAAGAQTIEPQLRQKGIKLYLNGVKQDRIDLVGLEGFDMMAYHSGRSKAIGGICLMSLGGVHCGLGVYGLCVLADAGKNPSISPSGFAGAATLANCVLAVCFEAIGIPLYFIGKSDIKEVVTKYNQGRQSKTTVSLGPCNNGLGLALNF